MITKVRLVNWRSHLNSELDFVDGTNALLGHMGSGKSSILDSICFALFGTFPALQSKKLKLDKIIMSKPSEKDRAEVEVFFHANGNKYSAKRVIEKRKGTTYSEIRENGKLLEAPSTQRVNEAVEKILKTNYELFTKAVYSEQNALDYFLTIPKGQRMKKIDELLMMEKFEKARSSSSTLANRMLERKLSKQNVLESSDTETLERFVEEFKQSIDALLLDKQNLLQKLHETVYEKTQMQKELSELAKVLENIQTLKSEEMAIKKVIDEISTTLNAVRADNQDPRVLEDEMRNLNNLIQEFEEVLSENQRKYQRLQEQSSRAKAEVELIRKEKIGRLESEVKDQTRIKKEFEELKKSIGGDIDRRLDEEKMRLEKFVGEVEALKIRVKDLQGTLEQLSSLGVKCPICERKLTKEQKIVLHKQKKSQAENLMSELTEAVKKRDSVSKELKGLEFAAKKLDEMIIGIKDLDNLKAELENNKHIYLVLDESSVKLVKELRQLESETEKLQRKFRETVSRKQETEFAYVRSKEYKEKSRRFEELASKRQIILGHLRELEASLGGKEVVHMENRFKQLLTAESELSVKARGIEDLVRERQERMKDFEKRLSIINKEKLDIKKLDKLVSELQIFGKALEQTQIELRKEFVASVNYAMNRIWQTLYPYQDYPSIRLSIEEGDYVLQLQGRNGDWNDVEGILSGGERSLAALALRIAFSLVLAPHLRLLILDEPTSNLDSRAISELAVTLRERIGEFITQTFLITHTPELEDAVNGTAYRLERDKSSDAPTNIIQLN